MAKKATAKKATRKGPTPIQRSRRVSPAAKAMFHQVTGAGKSKVKRKFFGLSREERADLVKFAARRIGQNIRLRFGR